MHAKRRFIGQRFFNTIPGISASYNSLENLTLLSLLGLKKIECSVEFLPLENHPKIALKIGLGRVARNSKTRLA